MQFGNVLDGEQISQAAHDAGGIGVKDLLPVFRVDRIQELLVGEIARLLPEAMASKLSALARTFSEGFAVAREPRALTLAFVSSSRPATGTTNFERV